MYNFIQKIKIDFIMILVVFIVIALLFVRMLLYL